MPFTKGQKWDRPKVVTAHLNLRVSPEQLAAWREAAERDGKELSAWVRGELDKSAKRK